MLVLALATPVFVEAVTVRDAVNRTVALGAGFVLATADLYRPQGVNLLATLGAAAESSNGPDSRVRVQWSE